MESVRVAHAAGLQVLAWGPQPAEVEPLIEAGVDCVIVDDAPATLARLGVAAGAVDSRR